MMVQETRMLLDNLVWNDGNFMEAFTADYSFLNSDLARSVRRARAGRRVRAACSFPATAHRARACSARRSFLASNAGPVETSPTARGMFVREQLLCQHVPNPPPGVNTQVPEPTTDRAAARRRQRMQAHVENPTCASCHRLMDPIGFGLENYDAIGEWRDKEADRVRVPGSAGTAAEQDRVSCRLTATGEIAGLTNSDVLGAARDRPPARRQPRSCQECVVKQVFRYAFGRLETAADRETIADACRRRFANSGFKFKELLIALVRSPQFLEGLLALR